MTRFQKIESLLIGLFMIAYVCLIIYLYNAFPDMAIIAILYGLTAVMAYNAVKRLIYYFTMARHMVGGRGVMYRGILYLDLAGFILTLQFLPTTYMMIYLVFLLGFRGAIDIFGAVDSHRIGAHWKLKFINGAIALFFCFYALFVLQNRTAVVYIYCLSLLSDAIIRIFNSLRVDPVVTFQ